MVMQKNTKKNLEKETMDPSVKYIDSNWRLYSEINISHYVYI